MYKATFGNDDTISYTGLGGVKKNGINKGVVLVKRINELTLLYSFATKTNGIEFASEIENKKDFFYSIGDHCFEQINPIYQRYACEEKAPKNRVATLNHNIIRFPGNV